MSGAFVAVADDASAVFWNPAGIARLEEDKTQLLGNVATWPADLKFYQGTVIFHVKGLPGAVALHARSLSMDQEPERTAYLSRQIIAIRNIHYPGKPDGE